MNRHLLTVALLGALANMPLAHADDAHAAVHADTMATTTLDGIVVVGVAPSMATTFITDPKLPRQPGPAAPKTNAASSIHPLYRILPPPCLHPITHAIR